MSPELLRKKLGDIKGSKIEGTYYRVVQEKDKREIYELWPSQVYGWRFNPKGGFGALYLCDSLAVGLKEKFKHCPNRKAFVGIRHVVGEVKIKIEKCLDLTDEDVIRRLGIDREMLISDDYSFTVELAAVARELGFEGIVYESAPCPGHKNMALFADKLHQGSKCTSIGVKDIKDLEIRKNLTSEGNGDATAHFQ